MKSKGLRRVSTIIALGLTVDVSTRAWDHFNPRDNGLRSLYHSLPLRAVSRAWGSVASTRVPKWMRPSLYGAYSWMYGVKLDEMRDPISSYECIQDFFTRELK